MKVVVIEAQADGIGRKAWGKAPGGTAGRSARGCAPLSYYLLFTKTFRKAFMSK